MIKNINKLKQWTGEKLGQAKATHHSDDFKHLEQETERVRECVEKLHSAVSLYLRTLGKKKETIEDKRDKAMPIEAMGASMIACGFALPESPYTNTLKHFGEAQERLGLAQMEFITNVKEGFLASLDRTYAEIKEYQQIRKKLESRRLDYDGKLGRLQKAKKEKPELEEEVMQARHKFEETEAQCREKMVAILEAEEEHQRQLVGFMQAQLEYFRQSEEIMRSVSESWGEPAQTRESVAPLSRTPSAPNILARRATDESSRPASSRNNSETSLDSANDSTLGRSRSLFAGKTMERASSRELTTPSPTARSLTPTGGGVTVDRRPAPPPPTARSAPAPPRPAPQKAQVRATYDFQGESEEELSMKRGDVITVLEKIDDGWWVGEITSGGTRRAGMFPVNYTEEISRPPLPERKPSSTSISSTGSSHNQRSNAGIEYVEDSASSPFADAVALPGTPRSYTSTPSPGAAVAAAARGGYFTGVNVGKPGDQGASSSTCRECGCEDYQANLFKPGSCNNCFHKH
ncbi:uncharacterized protein VTP21DRAFT_3140 [Calcarisporiella thermophila]|uniref:uncharacterized protein n=1 Tax=Calcarisporiella thermophila TaxID=911321 RepID=UPI003742A57A